MISTPSSDPSGGMESSGMESGGMESSGMESSGMEQYRRELTVDGRTASCLDTGGDGPVAVFLHGLGTSSYLWRHVIPALAGERRYVALDLPLHGRTPAAPDEDFSLGALAEFVTGCCDALGLAEFDLVANDTGGAISQVVAARHPGRLRSLTLTNCETHDKVPPPALRLSVLAARAGLLAPTAPRLFRNLPKARKRFFAMGYQDVEKLPLDMVRAWLEPIGGTRARARQFQRWVAELDPRDLLAAEPALRRLEVPTLIMWGTDDRFFPVRDAYWLRDTIPGATNVVELPGARLFFPDERAGELVAGLRRHWRVPVG